MVRLTLEVPVKMLVSKRPVRVRIEKARKLPQMAHCKVSHCKIGHCK